MRRIETRVWQRANIFRTLGDTARARGSASSDVDEFSARIGARPALPSSRYECKYLLRPEQLAGVRRFVAPFVAPDRYAQRHVDHTYPVVSSYLDSPDLRLHGMTAMGSKTRFKLRVRTYGDAFPDTAFLEIKKRYNGIVLKDRVALDAASAAELLAVRPRVALNGLGRRLDGRATDVVYRFLTLCRLLDARRVIVMRYMREAYESHGIEPVRITFDTALEYAVLGRPSALVAPRRWVRARLAGPVLEIKFTERSPGWVRQLVRTFELDRRSVPKYVTCVDQALATGRLVTDRRAAHPLVDLAGLLSLGRSFDG